MYGVLTSCPYFAHTHTYTRTPFLPPPQAELTGTSTALQETQQQALQLEQQLHEQQALRASLQQQLADSQAAEQAAGEQGRELAAALACVQTEVCVQL